MPRRAWLAAVLLATGLAGFFGGSAGPGTGPGPEGSGEGNATLALPVWAPGDFWSYGIEAGAGPAEESVTTYAIVGDAGADWTMATDSPERAFQDARDDVSRLGPQRKSDLAGSQGSDRVEFFRWPLAAGLNWSTRWDRQDVKVAVDEVDAAAGLARLTARNATHVMYTYTYSAKDGWFKRLERHGPDGGVAFSLVLQKAGHGWAGTTVHYTLATLFDDGLPLGSTTAPNLQVPAGTTDLWLRYHLPCSTGAYEVLLEPQAPANPGYDSGGQCAGAMDFEGVAVEAPAAGGWTLSASLVTDPMQSGGAALLLARARIDTPYP